MSDWSCGQVSETDCAHDHLPEQVELLSAQRFVLGVAVQEVPLKVVGTLGEAALAPEVYPPVTQQRAAHGCLSRP